MMNTVITYKDLLNKCLGICNILQPILKIIYSKKELVQTKADNSHVTLADILVQTFLRLALEPFVEKFIGEESIHYDFLSHSTTNCKIPLVVTDPGLKNLITTTYINFMNPIFKTDLQKIKLKGLTAFIDPIDGTSEFTKQKGHESTICIGFAKEGRPCAGIIYRVIPLQDSPEYALGSKIESLYIDTLKKHTEAEANNRFLTSNGEISPFLKALIDTGYKRVCSGGCGNKTLLLLENKGDIYIQDRGLSRWDTCAAQAILEAAGGSLYKLSTYLEYDRNESYTYTESEVNSDPNPAAYFSKMNSDRAVNTLVGVNNNLLKPYSNVCGLFACLRVIPNIRSNIDSVNAQVKPTYN